MARKQIIINPDRDNLYSDTIQKAINSLVDSNGGELIFNSGVYYSKPIKLISNLTLTFSKDVIINFSNIFSDYSTQFTRWEGTECFALRSQIFAENCKNIVIQGSANINGNGQIWWDSYKKIKNGIFTDDVVKVQNRILPKNRDIIFGSGGGGIESGFLRPSLVQFKDCENISISDVILKNSPFWNTHILYSKNIAIKNVTFENPEDGPNTDGLDIDSSSFVKVENSIFNVGDDCLCIKSGMDKDGQRVGKSCNNIKVNNCTMNKGHGGIVIGSETAGGVYDIDIENCSLHGTDRGIRVKTRRGRGGLIKNIYVSNIYMENVICPIVVNMYYKCGALKGDIPYLSSNDQKPFSKDSTPVIENISLDNIVSKNIKSAAGYFYGLPESPIKNLRISNFMTTCSQDKQLLPPAMDFFNTEPKESDFIINNCKDLKLNNINICGVIC